MYLCHFSWVYVETRKLVIYTPHDLQRRFHASTKRYRIAAVGRQVGKSTMANMEMLMRAWENPDTHYMFISPVFSQAKEQFRRQIAAIPEEIVDKKSETELRIDLINKSSMEYVSGDNPHVLRGKTKHGILIDEYRDQNPDLWSQVIRPIISTTRGWIAVLSTPNGFDAFYDLSQTAIANPDDWELFTGPSTLNPLFTQQELEASKKVMGEAQFAQEIMAEFRDLTSGKVYVNAGIHNLKSENPLSLDGKLHPMLGIIVALDFNVGFMNWTLGQKRGNQYYWFDELCVQNTHTQEHAELLAKYLVPLNHKPGVIIIGDATGSANKTSAVGQTDYDIICKTLDRYKIPWINMTPESNPTIKDRINAVNAFLKDASGQVNMWYNQEKCPCLHKDFQRVVWRQTSNSDRIVEDQIKDPSLTHSSSGVGYAVCALSPLTYDASIPTTKIIRR
ncbi:MAG TPA: hypothetical protein DGG95_15145 [Cytophagales bacterium]|jgi:hypothetical protein|nr:hypothetical protein [Cytophagales bacterium]